MFILLIALGIGIFIRLIALGIGTFIRLIALDIWYVYPVACARHLVFLSD